MKKTHVYSILKFQDWRMIQWKYMAQILLKMTKIALEYVEHFWYLFSCIISSYFEALALKCLIWYLNKLKALRWVAVSSAAELDKHWTPCGKWTSCITCICSCTWTPSHPRTKSTSSSMWPQISKRNNIILWCFLIYPVVHLHYPFMWSLYGIFCKILAHIPQIDS